MARYGLDFAETLRDPRRPPPLANIRSPHQLQRSRQSQHQGHHQHQHQHRQHRSDSRISRDVAAPVEAARDVVSGVSDDYADRPVNVTLNYGPVHVHQTCNCPAHSPYHTCLPSRLPPPARSRTPNPNIVSYGLPQPPPPGPVRRSSHPAPPRPRHLPAHNPSSPAPVARPAPVLVDADLHDDSDVDDDDGDDDDDDDDDDDRTLPPPPPPPPARRSSYYRPPARSGSVPPGSRSRYRRSSSTAPSPGRSSTAVVGLCEGCLTRQPLVDGRLCADCDYFAYPSSSGATTAPRDRDRDRDRERDRDRDRHRNHDRDRGRDRDRDRDRLVSAWDGVRYVPVRGGSAAARREVHDRMRERDRARWAEIELEIRERERAAPEDREIRRSPTARVRERDTRPEAFYSDGVWYVPRYRDSEHVGYVPGYSDYDSEHDEGAWYYY